MCDEEVRVFWKRQIFPQYLSSFHQKASLTLLHFLDVAKAIYPRALLSIMHVPIFVFSSRHTVYSLCGPNEMVDTTELERIGKIQRNVSTFYSEDYGRETATWFLFWLPANEHDSSDVL